MANQTTQSTTTTTETSDKRPRVTITRAVQWIVDHDNDYFGSTEPDGVETMDEIEMKSSVELVAHLFGIETKKVAAAVYKLRAHALAKAALDALAKKSNGGADAEADE